MSAEITLVALPRNEFGKGASRRIRRAGQIPAVMYGHGAEPVHLSLPGHQTMMALKAANALLSIELDGGTQLALAKDIQRHPVRPVIEHVDLVVVRRGEKVTVDVAIHVVGDAAPETVVTVENQTVELAVEATHIPQSVEVSVQGVRAGTQILAAALTLPEGAELVTDGDILIVNVTAAISEEALEAELADAESEAGIERDAPEGEETSAPADAAAAGDQA